MSQTGDRTKLYNCLTSGKNKPSLLEPQPKARPKPLHIPGAIPGTTCMAEEPDPITATTLPFRSKLVSQAAVCNNFPLKDFSPSTSGHFQTLVLMCQQIYMPDCLMRTYFNAPLVLRRTSASSMKVLPLGRWISQTHLPFSSSQVLCRTLCWSLTNLCRSNLSAVSWRYFRISLPGE